MTRRARGLRSAFPPPQRVEIEQLACCAPAGLGPEMTHRSTRALAQVAVEREIVPQIAHSTISLILRHASLQPHRSRYWQTPTLNEKFRERASRILWCYEQVDRLVERGGVGICPDEKPNVQALERIVSVPPRAGQIEHQEFGYIRHGAVNFLVALRVHDGHMGGWRLDKNDSEHLSQVLPVLLEEWAEAKRIHLIWDGGPSHVSQATQRLLRSYGGQVRVLMTPAHASWLNQAELLLRAFADRYLDRGSWKSRQALIRHLDKSWREYNQRFAHPFTWSWTRRDMRKWMARQLD